jgi:hypothetical protein
VLTVHRDGFSAGQLRHVDAMATPSETDENAFVPEPSASDPVACTNRAKQIDSALLEDACSDAIDDVLAIAVFDDDRVDAVEMEEMSEQQAGRTSADDAYLSSHGEFMQRAGSAGRAGQAGR